MRQLAILLCLTLAACAQQVPAAAVVDTFCLRAELKTWSVEDSAETISRIEAENATVARRCGKKMANS